MAKRPNGHAKRDRIAKITAGEVTAAQDAAVSAAEVREAERCAPPRQVRLATVRQVGDHSELDAWLSARFARWLWTSPGNPTTGAPTVQGWRVGSGVAIVLLYWPTRGEVRAGWGIATEPDSISISETLADADLRCGVKS